MPTTRALSARLQATTPTPDAGEQAPLKASLAPPRLFRRTTSQPQPLLGGRRAFARTVSMPAVCAPEDGAGSSSGSAPRTRSAPSSAASSSSTPSRRTSVSRTRSSCGAGDDAPDGEQPPHAQRVGGCSQDSAALDARDDSNKENVAPLRQALDMTERQRMAEARDAQEEAVARRTRASAASPMQRRAPSPAASATARRLARPSMSSSASARSLRSDGPARSLSGSSSFSAGGTRKRPRNAHDDELSFEALAALTPGASMSRLRLNDGAASSCGGSLASPSVSGFSYACDDESYFSSQGTATSSLFDSQPCDSQASRCLTPASSVPSTPTLGAKELPAAETPTFANVYSHARALLRCSSGTDDVDEGSEAAAEVQVVGREKERKTLQRFLNSRFELYQHLEHSAHPAGEGEALVELDGAQDSGALYVCGMPGTGKTALLRSILAQLREDQLALPAPRIAFVNCMTIEHPRAIFAKVLQALGERADVPASAGTDAVADAVAERDLGALVKDPKRRTLIVLDEIDHLLRNRAQQNVLYRLFSWAATAAPSKNGRGTCALIGIANSLDLTERFVPLLASKGAAPALLHFRPFGAAEIVSVVRARLCGLRERYDGGIVAEETMDVDPTPALFTPAALELAAKKIAQATGDLRKALDAARLAVDAVETEQRKKLLAVPGSEDSTALLAHFTPTDAPKVTPAHILRVLSAVLGSPQLAKVRSLGLQPKLVLLAILVAQRRAQEGLAVLGSGSSGSHDGGSSKSRALRLLDVEATYAAAIKNDGCAFSTLEASEFLDVVELLGVHGLVSTSEGQSDAAAASSAGARRASKKQLQAANRSVALAIGADEVLKGITTPPPASSGVAPQTSTLEAVRRMWNAEEERIRRTRGWEARAREMQSVRDVELGGGRMAQGSF